MIHANRAKQGAKLICCVSMQTYGSDGEGGMASGSPRQAWHPLHHGSSTKTVGEASQTYGLRPSVQLFVNQASAKIEMLDTYLNGTDIYNSVETILQEKSKFEFQFLCLT